MSPEAVPEIYRSAADLQAAVGRELGPTSWVPVDQARVDGFAAATEDRQWIHVDPDRAANGPFGSTVAHGFLTLSLIPYFLNSLRRIEGVAMGVNYGLNKVRFPAPVRVGSLLRARTTMIGLDLLDEQAVQAVNRLTIEVESQDKPACVADLVGRYYFR
jgi:acyl dehydratase